MEAIESGSHYEGDMRFTDEQLELLGSRSATSEAHLKWPKSGEIVPVPYVISSSFNQDEKHKLAKAIQEYESKTCIR